MLAHCNLKQNMCLCSKQSSLFSFYALPSGGKWKDAVVHCEMVTMYYSFPFTVWMLQQSAKNIEQDPNQRTLTIGGSSITVLQLVSSFTSLDSTASQPTYNNIFSSLVESTLVKLETKCTVSPFPYGECLLRELIFQLAVYSLAAGKIV